MGDNQARDSLTESEKQGDLLFGRELTPPKLLESPTDQLEPSEIERLWDLFQQIGRTWDNVSAGSAGQRSSWLEFIDLRCTKKPSYLAEYRSALQVVQELVDAYGLVEGYRQLFFNGKLTGETKDPSKTMSRLRHAKVFVVDEFIRVQIVAGGFRGFGGRNRAYNYNGFLRGTRYNRVQRVRTYRPKKDDKTKRDSL
jgi:hypothetical protein